MQVLDLGDLDGPVLAFGGPYSNLASLRALRARAAVLGIPAARVICTGDVVAYCAEAAESVAEMRDWGVACVAGNCEKQLSAGAADCGCGFEAGSTCDLLSTGWYAHATAACGPQERAWMAACPDIVTFTQDGQRCAVIHGGVTDIARFIWACTKESVFEEELAALSECVGPVDLVIAGHCGIPFDRQAAGVRWVNAGVIGLPPNDGAAETRFVVLDKGDVTVQHLRYDAEATRQAMKNAGLTQGYHEAVVTGWWPSEDVLPPELRRVQSLASG
ncbi:MAG: metallophosphoesterase family protein [Paracoccaceae bacterium]|nr:metallophosphoesterase family protein [Paracoccaceae bacterium]